MFFIIIIIVSIPIFFLKTYNSLVNLSNQVDEALGMMDIYLKKRWDLIPNIVEVVKAYATHEKKTLENISKLRSLSYDQIQTSEKISLDLELSKEILIINQITENYPELKSNQNFLDLNTKLTNIENDIANARKYYNSTVTILNNKIEMFPSNLIAKKFGYKPQKMLELNYKDAERITL